jgi:hypothetical protein
LQRRHRLQRRRFLDGNCHRSRFVSEDGNLSLIGCGAPFSSPR